MKITAVPPDEVHNIWPNVAEHLRKAILRFPVASIGDIFYDCSTGKSLLWAIYEVTENGPEFHGAFTTSMRSTSVRKSIGVDFMGGHRMGEWLDDAMKAVEGYARQNNCTHIEGYGRKGWAKQMAKYNFKLAFPVIERDLRAEDEDV